MITYSRICPKDIVLAFVLGGAVMIAVSVYAGPSSGDDTFIYMRYVENYLHNKGFVYNSGEYSHGVTSSLWPLIMTPLSFLFGNTLSLWKFTSALFTGAAASFLFLSLRQKAVQLLWAMILVGIVMCEPHSFRWNASGMENGLVFFVMALLVFFWQRILDKEHDGFPKSREEIGLGILAGILPFVRPELALFSFGLAVYYFIRKSRISSRPWIFATAYVATGALLGLITWWLFRSLIPQTAEAKAFFLKQADPFYGVVKSSKLILSGSSGCLLLMLTIRSKIKEIHAWRVLTIFFLLITISYLGWVNQIISSRYASYLNFPIMLAAFLLIANQLSMKGRPSWWILCCFGIQILLTGGILYTVFPVTRVSENAEIKKVAAFLATNTEKDARIALSEIGALGFYSHRYIIDLFGLTDPATLAWKNKYGRPETKKQLEKLLLDRQATYYIDTSATETLLHGEFIRFEPIGEFSVQRNIFFQGKHIESRWRIYALTQY